MVLKRRLGKGDVSEEDSRHIPFYFGIRPFYFPIKLVSKNSEIHTVFQNGAFCILKVPVLHCKSASFTTQKCQFCNAKVPVLQRKMVRFATQNGAFCKPFRNTLVLRMLQIRFQTSIFPLQKHGKRRGEKRGLAVRKRGDSGEKERRQR